MRQFFKFILVTFFSLNLYAQYPSCGKDYQIQQKDIDSIIQKYREYRNKHYPGNQANYLGSEFYKEDVDKITKLTHKVFEHEKFLLEQLSFTNPEQNVSGVLCSDITSINLQKDKAFQKYVRVSIVKDEAKTIVHGLKKDEFDYISPRFTKHIDMSDTDFGSGLAYKVDSPWLLGCSLNLNNAKKTHHVFCLVPNFTFSFSHKIFHPRTAPRDQRYKEVANCRSSGITGEANTHQKSNKVITNKNKEKGYYEADLDCTRKRSLSERVLVTARGDASGSVIDKLTGETIQKAKVDIVNDYFARSNDDGHYVLNDLPLDLEKEKINGSHPKYHPNHTILEQLILGKVNSGNDIYLSPKTVDLSGTVFNKKTNQPVSNYDVLINLKYKYRTGKFFHKEFKAKTDKDGNYHIDKVYCTYNLAQLAPQTNAYELLSEKLDFDCSQSHTTRDFYLTPSTTSISGKITDLKTNETLEQVEVILLNKDTVLLTTTTDSNGSYKFEFDSVPFPYSGDFRILAKDKREFQLYEEKQRDDEIIDISKTNRTFTDSSNFFSHSQVLTYEDNINKNIALKPIYNDVSGEVRHLQTQSPISGVDIELVYRGKPVKVTTDSSGQFLFRHVPKGSYTIASNIEFYQPASITFQMDESDIDLKIEHSRVDLFGRLVNAEDGSLVTEFEEKGHLDTTPLISKNQIEITDGNYRIKNIEPLSYQLHASIEGFYPSHEIADIDPNNYLNEKDIILLPKSYAKDRIIIILTWGKNPRDLDSQIVSNNVLLNYKLISSSQNSLTGGIYARLDVDDVSSFGPETTVIQLHENGTPINPKPYEFLVYHYSGSGTLKTSKANVRVYDNGSKISDIKINKNEDSTSRLWHVLSVVNGNVIIRNQLKFKHEYAKITNLWTEIHEVEDKLDTVKNMLSKLESAAAKHETNKLELREALKKLFLISGSKDVYEEIYGKKAKIPSSFESRIQIVAYNIEMSEKYESSQVATLESNLLKLREKLSTAQGSEIRENLIFEISTLENTKEAIQDGSNEQYKADALADLEALKKEASELSKSLTKIDEKIKKSALALNASTGSNISLDKKTNDLKGKIDSLLEIIKSKQSKISEIELEIAKKLSKYH